ncbi:hypothetical protein F2Q69_00009017 [Brassica cretica]|uniref:Uncharacterized protein n=1 Tax=Brassica cretica TaxID=69181 RepID=A0A8S9PC33_BRACR|nr:hypothetical protein F2Q69_00009017 [Brassica cretica]
MEEEEKQITCLMSVIVCGGKRSLFETSSLPLSKKLCSLSPSRFSSSLLLDHLAAILPDMDIHVSFSIPKVSNFVVGYLQDSSLESTNQKPELSLVQEEAKVAVRGRGGSSGKEEVLNLDGTEWVELFNREMTNASDMKQVCSHASSETSTAEQQFHP